MQNINAEKYIQVQRGYSYLNVLHYRYSSSLTGIKIIQ